MGAMASQITGVTIDYSTVFSGAEERHILTGEFPHKRSVTRKMFLFDDVVIFFAGRDEDNDIRHCM